MSSRAASAPQSARGVLPPARTHVARRPPACAPWARPGTPPQGSARDEATVPLGAYEATHGLDDIGYTGPCPPAGSTHRYAITVHYLDNATGLDNGTPATELIAAITSAQTASAEVTGTFSRN